MVWQTIGQEPARRFLERSLAAGRVAHAYLFVGPPGSGKTTLALDFARALICTGIDRPCDACAECRLLRGPGHPDVDQVESDEGDEAMEFSALWKPGAAERPRRALRIERVRELIRVMATRPSQAAYRVATLDGTAVQDAAASALLKLFEEPATNSVLLLRATAVEALPPPIVSRCQVIRLTTVAARQIADWLIASHGVAPEDALSAAALSGGRPGLARRLAAAPEARRSLDAQAAMWLDLASADTVGRLTGAAGWARNYATARAALDLAGLVWHALIQRAANTSDGGAGEGASSPPLAAFATEAADRLVALGVPALGEQLAAIARASRLIDANVQPRLALEWLMLELGRARPAA